MGKVTPTLSCTRSGNKTCVIPYITIIMKFPTQKSMTLSVPMTMSAVGRNNTARNKANNKTETACELYFRHDQPAMQIILFRSTMVKNHDWHQQWRWYNSGFGYLE